MKTVWQYSIHVRDERCVCSASEYTLEKAIQSGFRDMIYYKAIYPNDSISIVDMREMCAKCSNTALMTVYKRFGSKQVKCSECKGKCPTRTLGDITLEMPDAANKITLHQAS